MPVLAILAAALITPAEAITCTCPARSPCEQLDPNRVVFIGAVLSKGGPLLRMRVEERLQNIDSRVAEVDLHTSEVCSQKLERGKRYLILAHGESSSGAFHVDPCTPTFDLPSHNHVLAAIRNRLQGGAPRILGTVHRITFDSDGGNLPGATVTAVSGTQRHQTTTDASGNFEFTNVANGSYEVSVSRPGYAAIDSSGNRSVRIESSACPFVRLNLSPDGEIAGAVKNAAGKPVPGIWVDLFRRSFATPVLSSQTDRQGRYSLRPLPPGDYITTIVPKPENGALDVCAQLPQSAVRLAESQHVNIPLALPTRRNTIQLSVSIVDPTGKPFRFANLSLLDRNGVERWNSRRSSANLATIRVPAAEGGAYTIRARATEHIPPGYHYLKGEAIIPTASAGTAIVLKLTGKRFPIPK